MSSNAKPILQIPIFTGATPYRYGHVALPRPIVPPVPHGVHPNNSRFHAPKNMGFTKRATAKRARKTRRSMRQTRRR
jgi:hypothetical protein